MSALALLCVLVGLAMFGGGGQSWLFPSLILLAIGAGAWCGALMERW